MFFKRAWPLTFQQIFAPCLIIFISLIAYLFKNQSINFFVYQRDLISQGQFWRLLTGHFFHTNLNHLLLNLTGLIMLWALHGNFYTIKNYLLVFLVSALTCSLGLYYFSPDLQQYVGLSGVLHGIFVWGAMMDIKHKEKTGYLLLVGVTVKIIHEQFYGASAEIVRLIGANVAVNAHLWGAIGGFIFGCFYLLLSPKVISPVQ